jgi:hypothetical protein
LEYGCVVTASIVPASGLNLRFFHLMVASRAWSRVRICIFAKLRRPVIYMNVLSKFGKPGLSAVDRSDKSDRLSKHKQPASRSRKCLGHH